jgi:hypothetical protein
MQMLQIKNDYDMAHRIRNKHVYSVENIQATRQRTRNTLGVK